MSALKVQALELGELAVTNCCVISLIVDCLQGVRLVICVLKSCLQQLTAKFVQVGINNPSTPDSSSGSSTGSLHNMYDGPNLEAENCLPGVVSKLCTYRAWHC